jgi:pyruvate decarboxylase
LLHHTLGTVDYDHRRRIFAEVCALSIVLHNLEDAPTMIDGALMACLQQRRPVYIEVPCNLAARFVPAPGQIRVDRPKPSDPDALAAAVAASAQILGQAVHPVLVAGVKLRAAGAIEAFRSLADSLGCAVAVMPDAKINSKLCRAQSAAGEPGIAGARLAMEQPLEPPRWRRSPVQERQ